MQRRKSTCFVLVNSQNILCSSVLEGIIQSQVVVDMLQECVPIKLTFTFSSYFGVFIIYDIGIMQACPLNLRSLMATVNKVHLLFHCCQTFSMVI